MAEYATVLLGRDLWCDSNSLERRSVKEWTFYRIQLLCLGKFGRPVVRRVGSVFHSEVPGQHLQMFCVRAVDARGRHHSRMYRTRDDAAANNH